MPDKKLRIEVESKADTRGIKRMGEAAEELKADLKQVENQLEKTGQETDEFRKDIDQLDNEMDESSNSADGLRRAIKAQEKVFAAHNKTSISLKSTYKQLRKSGEGTKEEFEELSRRIKISQDREVEAISATRRLVTQFDNLQTELGQSSNEFDDLNKNLNSAEGWINGMTNAVRRADKNMGNLTGSVDRVGDGVNRAGRKIDNLGGEVNQVGKKFDKAGAQVKKFGFAMPLLVSAGNLLSEGLQEAARAAVEFAKESVQSFHDFDRGAREVFTLVPDMSADMRDALKADVLAMGKDLGRLPEEMLPAVYNALSAGVPEENVLTAVQTASEAARAGVADLDSTLKLGLGILNAQVTGVSNLEEVYDLLFFTVKNGVITMPEMNDVMSQVTSVAGEAGVSMQDISAAMVVMTKQGDSAAEAAELLSIMLTQLSTSGTTMAETFREAAGTSFRDFIASGGDLAGAMEILQEHANNTGQALGDILGGGSPFFRDTQAARGALELTGKHLDELIDVTNEAGDAIGTMTEAGKEMGESAELKAQQAASAWEGMKIAIGESLRPTTDRFYDLKFAIAESTEEFLRSKAEIEQVDATTHNLVQTLLDAAQGQEAFTDAFTGSTDPMDAAEETLTLINTKYGAYSTSIEEANARTAALEKATEMLNQGFAGTGRELAEQAIAYGEQTVAVETLTEATRISVDDVINTALAYKEASENTRLYTEDIIAAELAQREAAETTELAAEANIDYSQSAEERAAAEEAIAAAAEERAARIAAAAEAEREALIASRQEFNAFALEALDSGESLTAWTDGTINWTDELFRNASQMGINAEQTAILAAATGEYSDEQIEAMLKTAAMRQAVEQLSANLANGTMTTAQAMDAMALFKKQLEDGLVASLDYSDFAAAQGQAENTRGALLAAEGDYHAKFTTTNTTINRTINEEPVTRAAGSKKNDDRALHTGGRFKAGEFLIVGDGPGGQILPTTELVVFDRPGEVFSGQETNKLFNETGPNVSVPNNEFEGLQLDVNKAGTHVKIDIHVYNAREADTAYKVRDELEEAVQGMGWNT